MRSHFLVVAYLQGESGQLRCPNKAQSGTDALTEAKLGATVLDKDGPLTSPFGGILVRFYLKGVLRQNILEGLYFQSGMGSHQNLCRISFIHGQEIDLKSTFMLKLLLYTAPTESMLYVSQWA